MFKTNPNKMLLKAAEKGRLDRVKKALELGADINYRGEYKVTPLMLAAYNKHEKIVQLLIEKQAYVNATDIFGETALMYTAYKDNLNIATILINADADLNHQRKNDNRTALMIAVNKDAFKVVKALVEAGANINLEDHNGKTALELAESPHIYEYLSQHAKALKQKDADQNIPLYTAVNAYTVSKYQGKIDRLGHLRMLFNFKSQTVTEVIDKTAGVSRDFYDFTTPREIIEAYEWMRAQNYDISHPFEKNAVSPFKTIKV